MKASKKQKAAAARKGWENRRRAANTKRKAAEVKRAKRKKAKRKPAAAPRLAKFPQLIAVTWELPANDSPYLTAHAGGVDGAMAGEDGPLDVATYQLVGVRRFVKQQVAVAEKTFKS